jgi:DNA-binding NarL/FixJ family response regulator
VTSLRVVVADDSVLLREGLVRVLIEAGHEIVGAFGDADSLLAEAAALAPDLAVLDVRMPPTFRDEGVRAAIKLRTDLPGTGILLLSQYVEVAYAQELLGAGSGGVGYLLKDRVSRVDEFVDALRRVADGGTVMDPEVVAQLLVRRRRGVDRMESLTPREREVLALMAEGRGNGDIATHLTITERAVHKHVGNIFGKLDLPPSDSGHRRVLAVLAYLNH